MTNTEPNVPDSGRYNTKEACDILGLSYKTLMKRIAEGFLSFDLRKDGSRYFKGSSLKRFWRTY